MRRVYEYDLCTFIDRHDLSAHPLIALRSHFGDSDERWIAGGAVRSFVRNAPLSSDIDVFFKSEEAYHSFVREFAPDKCVEREHHTTFEFHWDGEDYLIQAIRFAFYDSVEAVVDSFDFTICQFALHNNRLVCGEYALWDLARERLAVHQITFAASSVRRMIKYARQGFFVCQGCVVSLLDAVAQNPSLIRADMKYVD